MELGTTSGTGNLYFTLELVTAVRAYLNLNFRSFEGHNSFPWLGSRLYLEISLSERGPCSRLGKQYFYDTVNKMTKGMLFCFLTESSS